MSKNLPFFTIVALIILIVGGFVYYQKNYVAKYRWFEDYGKNSEQPYGLHLLYSAIKDGEQGTTIIYNQALHVLDTTAANMNFISVSPDADIDSVMADQLISFAAKGNNVFIASTYSPLKILRNFIPVGEYINNFRSVRDSNATITFAGEKPGSGKKFSFHFQFYKKRSLHYWKAYNNSYFQANLAPYGFDAFSYLNDTTVNCFVLQHGKGKIIVHSNPLLFTNYYLCTKEGLEHTNKLLSLLHNGPTYWYDGSYNSKYDYAEPHKNPLKLLFSHPYLKWGWYLFLANILLYLLFRSKREQRIIPLMPANNNASIEYTRAIGELYFRSKKHFYLVNELYTIFLAEVRNRYHIRTDIPQAELTEQISQRSGVGAESVQYLFKQFKLLRNRPDAELQELTDLYRHIEDFNKKRK
jgi:hypothetical protein